MLYIFVCVYVVSHLHAWYLQMSVEAVGSPGLELWTKC